TRGGGLMNADFPADDLGPREAGIDELLSILTSEPAPGELAGEQNALAMFRAASQPKAAPIMTSMTAEPSTATPPAAAPPAGTAPAATPPTGRPTVQLRSTRRYLRPAWISGIAGLAVAAGLVTAAYTKALPAPVQHVAYQALGFAGVPDSHRHLSSPPGSSSQPGGGSGPGSGHHGGSSGPAPAPGSAPPSASHSASPSPSGSPHPTGSGHGSPRPGQSPSPSPQPSSGPTQPSPTSSPTTPVPPIVPAALSLTVAQPKVTAGSSDSFTGLLSDAKGVPVPGRHVRLQERPAGQQAWQPAGQTVTGSAGIAVLTVPSVATNAAFRLVGPHRTKSGPVHVIAIPVISLTVTSGKGPRSNVLIASSPLAGPGDLVVLQSRQAGVWQSLRQHPLDAGQTSFTVKLGHTQHAYRVVLLRTPRHGRSLSRPVVLPPLGG
ncbi:MAG: hypothetical protein ABJB47_09450, partial [Actinomycetota bacterium]